MVNESIGFLTGIALFGREDGQVMSGGAWSFSGVTFFTDAGLCRHFSFIFLSGETVQCHEICG